LRALGPSSDRAGTGLIAEEDRYQNESGGDRVMPLDPAIAQIIPLLPLRDPATMTPQRARDELRALASARPDLPLPEVRAVESAILKGPAGSVPARVYRVAPAPSPTVLFFHGGGFVAGDLDTHDRQARRLAIETGAVVVSVDYRRPPEMPFPSAFEDCFGAVRDVVARIDKFGRDAGRLGVAGDSAGGNLAAATAIACRDEGIRLAGQLLVYPATDAAEGSDALYPSRSQNAKGYFLTQSMIQWFLRQYLSEPAQGSDWRVSPLRANTHAGLAPAVVCTAWFDPLRDEGEAYADALSAAGVETKRYHGPGLIHGYFGMGEVSEAARIEAHRARTDFRAMLERGA
jgi:acetyl esterase